MKRSKETEKLRKIKIALCGELPTVCEYLRNQGIINIDEYDDAVNIRRVSDYHFILVYAPQAEGLLNTYIRDSADGGREIPIRLLGEPCCHAILLEIKMKINRIASSLPDDNNLP